MSRRRMMYSSKKSLPAEYEAVEKVTAFPITTTIWAHNTVWNFDISNPNDAGSRMFAAHNISGGCYVGVSGGKYWLGGGVTSTSSCSGRQTPIVKFFQVM